MNFILWDVDGTLVRNGKDAGNLYHEALEKAVGLNIENRLPNTHGKTDGQIITETLAAHGLDPELHSSVIHHLDELSRLRHDAGRHRELCPYAIESVAAAAAAGWRNGLLTGNSAARARYKISGAGFDASVFEWEHSYFGERSPVRSDLTLRARKELGDARVVIIGDTPNDDVAAQAAGMEFIGVATGAFTAEVLRSTAAIAVVENLESGLADVLAALGSPRSTANAGS
ncbi:MAG: HAD family hydrolase [Microbacteriaceae bacterium]